MDYIKPFFNLDDQVLQLERRGLYINDKDAAKDFLSKVSYYKFSGYTLFFEEKDISGIRSHKFIKGTSFDNIKNLYLLDKELRTLIWPKILEIEVFFKTTFTNKLAEAGGCFVLYDKNNFKKEEEYFRMIENLHKAIYDNRNELFVNHHIKRYWEYTGTLHISFEEFKNQVVACSTDLNQFPVWEAAEIFTFGQISVIYANLKEELKQIIAKEIDLTPRALSTWLHAFTITRNICAHNSRLYNKEIKAQPYIFKVWEKDLSSVKCKQRIGPILFCIKEFLKKYDKDCGVWKSDIEQTVNSFKCYNEDYFLESMGLFNGWHKTDLWKI